MAIFIASSHGWRRTKQPYWVSIFMLTKHIVQCSMVTSTTQMEHNMSAIILALAMAGDVWIAKTLVTAAVDAARPAVVQPYEDGHYDD